jgi:nickel transport protein
MKIPPLICVLAAAAPAALAGSLAAHGLDIEVRRHAPAIVLKAAYSGSEPVAFAVVKIYAPGTSPVAYQSGNADASGRFAFVPDREGEWRAVVDDELGHREECRISVGLEFIEAGAVDPGEAASASLPLWVRAAVGLALIFGASGILYGLKARRRTGQ